MIKPTIIKTDEVTKKKTVPTVIQSVDHANKVSSKSEVKASIIGLAKPVSVDLKNPTIISFLDAEKIPDSIHPISPSKMMGFSRVRINVNMEDLKRKYPGEIQSILECTHQFILETDLDALTNSTALLWKSELQKEYSNQVMELLRHSEAECFAKASRNILRIVEILEKIDLMGVCAYYEEGLISKLLKNSSKAIDTPEELYDAEKELEQLTKLLSNQLKELIKTESSLNQLNLEIRTSGMKIKSASLAASYLSDYLLDKQQKKYAQQFSDRSISLMQSEAQVLQNEVSREMQLAYPLWLIATIQKTVLVMIPDWLGSVAAIRSLLNARKKITVTEVYELSDWKNKILKQLK